MICAIIFFAVSAYAAERAAVGIPEPQRLSAEGKSELLGIVSSGRLKTLQEPQFADYKAEIGEFYGSGGYALAWVRGSRPTAKARAVIRILQAADNKGLLAQDYDSPFWTARLAKLERPARRASEHDLLRFDIALTICAMRYILDLHLGRINPKLFYCGFDAEPDIRGPSDYLRKRVVCAEDMEAAFSAIEPPFPSYRRLVHAVHRYREFARLDDKEQLPAAGLPVKPGDHYSGVQRLTRLLSLLGDLPPSAVAPPELYAGPLVKAVKHFQRRHGLKPDGFLGEQTLKQLNIPLALRLRQLQLTLERWRWLPHRFSRPPILVNIPEFRLYAGDEPSQKVVVGMAFEHQTPVFTSQVTQVVFRPPWTVPISILRSDLAPKIEKDPGYLEKNDFEVIDGKDAVVSSGTVSAAVLDQLLEGRLYLRQRPGPNNSLGLVKFLLPNSNSVYLHGTPSRRGFREERRDFSHSCIRVEDPESLAIWALRGLPEWTPVRIHAAIEGTETVTVKLSEPIPVLVQYGTAAVGEDGEVRFFDDIYNRDAADAEAFDKRASVAAR